MSPSPFSHSLRVIGFGKVLSEPSPIKPTAALSPIAGLGELQVVIKVNKLVSSRFGNATCTMPNAENERITSLWVHLDIELPALQALQCFKVQKSRL